MKPWITTFWIFLLGIASCSTQPDATQSSLGDTPGGRAGGQCSNGILDPREQANPDLCPQDANAQVAVTSPVEDIPPLYFFYVIHVHIANSDTAPYTDQSLTQLNGGQAENMLAAIEGIAEVLDRHGARGTWQVVYGTSKGLCAYQGQDHIFRNLSEGGHEIAIHVHNQEDIQPAFLNLQNACAITPDDISGFLVTVANVNPGLAQQIYSEDIRLSADLGMTVSTGNLSPADTKNPFGSLCDNQIGIDNDMWLQTGNLLFPWMPDYQHGNICSHDPQGDFVMLDHVSINWLMTGQIDMPDVLGSQQFDYLQQYLDGALDYMETYRPTRIAAWGFVTHIIEYAVGGQAENPPDPAALAALDSFLDYVDSRVAEGRIVYATASEIAEAAFPDR